jgi:hypothetical protein
MVLGSRDSSGKSIKSLSTWSLHYREKDTSRLTNYKIFPALIRAIWKKWSFGQWYKESLIGEDMVFMGGEVRA